MINDTIVPGSSYWNIAFGLGKEKRLRTRKD
jgi:hypothetical protein